MSAYVIAIAVGWMLALNWLLSTGCGPFNGTAHGTTQSREAHNNNESEGMLTKEAGGRVQLQPHQRVARWPPPTWPGISMPWSPSRSQPLSFSLFKKVRKHYWTMGFFLCYPEKFLVTENEARLRTYHGFCLHFHGCQTYSRPSISHSDFAGTHHQRSVARTDIFVIAPYEWLEQCVGLARLRAPVGHYLPRLFSSW